MPKRGTGGSFPSLPGEASDIYANLENKIQQIQFNLGNNLGKKGPKIVVGNALAGDTLAECNYLDAGDGVQLQAALSAASAMSPRSDVWVRPGPYTPTTTITIPGVTMRGASRGMGGGASTTFFTTTTNRKVFIMQAGSRVADLSIDCAAIPAVGATGTEIIDMQGTTLIDGVEISLAALTLGQVANESLTAAIRATANNSNVCENVTVTMGYSRSVLGAAGTITGIVMRGSDVGSGFIRASTTFGGDVGMEANGNVLISDPNIQRPQVTGLLAQSISALTGSVVCTGGFIRMVPGAAAVQGVRFATGGNAAGMRLGRVVGTKIIHTGASHVGSAGVAFTGTGVAPFVSSVSIDNFALGITISATTPNAQGDGVIIGATTPVTDSSGSFVNNFRVI